MLAAELRGDLRCARCRYNLRGLSVTGVCPECGTPVRATLLATVDPFAAELRPVAFPIVTAYGIILWSGAALATAMLVWWLRIQDFVGQSGWANAGWVRPAIVVCVALSAIGAIVLVRPHRGISPRASVAAALGVALYIPLCLVMYRLHAVMDVRAPAPYGVSAVSPIDRSVLRVFVVAALAGILLCLRPNARVLAARSFLMRTGRIDRQTMAAMLGVLGLIALGDSILIATGSGSGPVPDLLRQVGQLVILVGSILFSLGLVGILIDCVRLRPVILEPPLSLEDLIEHAPVNGAATKARAS